MRPSKTRFAIAILLVALASRWPTAIGSQQSGKGGASPLSAAQAKISHGQLEEAEKDLWNLLSRDPNQPQALVLLGVIRGRQKRYAEAEALFRRTLELDPRSAPAHRNLATALLAENKQDQAIEQYEQLLDIDPRDQDVKIELAQLYLAKGEFKDALSTVERIPPGQFPAPAVPVKAASLLGVGRRSEAAALIPSVKHSASTEAELAEVFLDANAPELALRAIDEAFSTPEPHPARLYYLKGRAIQAQGDIPGALKTLEQGLLRDPKSVEILLAIASIQASSNRHREALALLMRAYTLRPDAPEVLRPSIVEAVRGGEPKTASRLAHALVENHPDNLDDLYLASAAMLEGRDYPSATSILAQYVAGRPADPKGFLGLGVAELAQQHYPEAKKALERAIELDPTQADAEYQLGVLADRQGALLDARKHFERAIQLQPNHAKALANLGGEYLEAGELEKACEVLERAVGLVPDNAKAQYNLALTLAKLGRTEEAKRHMDLSRTLQTAEELGKSPPPNSKRP